MSDKADELKGVLRGLASKVPARIGSASIQEVRQYKETVKFAQKLLDSSRATVLNLQQAIQRLEVYHRPAGA